MSISAASRTWRTPRGAGAAGCGREGHPSGLAASGQAALARQPWLSSSGPAALASGTGLAASGQAALARPRRIAAPRSLQERRTRHSDDRGHARRLLAEAGALEPLASHPRGGCCWGAWGCSLRVLSDCGTRHVSRTDYGSPVLLNDSLNCLELRDAFPANCAVGLRGLQPGVLNRFAVELRTDLEAPRHIMQVGVARLGGEGADGGGGRLDESTLVLESVLCASSGDIRSCAGPLEVFAPSAGAPALVQRLDDWCSGGQTWLLDGSLEAVVQLEVDLRPGRGTLGISVGDSWSRAPAVVRVPGLLSDGPAWLPFVSLTAIGQEAKIVDFHVSMEL